MNVYTVMAIKRRNFLTRLAATFGGLAAGQLVQAGNRLKESMESLNSIIEIKEMGFQWETVDPFLFCVHHEDDFPKGNTVMGPAVSLAGRSLGDDFIIKDGFRMYHGKQIPGFPGHPHRGFETVTVVRKGLVDHADSLGAAGRYGNGDVQWMTAGKGVQHSEMFPLLSQEKENPLELFQIWLNLPAKDKMANPHFTMFWAEKMPKLVNTDKQGKKTTIEIISGKFNKTVGLKPPPNSWAANPANEVGIWNTLMDEGSTVTIPAASKGVNRMLYFYEGQSLKINGAKVSAYKSVKLHAWHELKIVAEKGNCKFLILQGKPINEPVIQYGPFVMNTKAEIQQAFNDYHQTQFGGWPWPRLDQVHPRNKGRFARHADGKEEKPA